MKLLLQSRLFIETLFSYIKYRWIKRISPEPYLPSTIHIIPTHRCNAKCLMCGIWKEKGTLKDELTLEQFDSILGDRLFRKLQFVGISGGEAFLRIDLLDLVNSVLSHCPSVKRISLTTNGLLTEKLKSTVNGIAELLREKEVLLDVSVSMHGLGSILEEIYGVQNAFFKILESLKFLKAKRKEGLLSVSLNCVLLKANLSHARELVSWAEDNELDIRFVVGEKRERFHNDECDQRFLGPENDQELVAFLGEMSNELSLRNPSSLRYRELISMYQNKKKRSLPCYYEMSGVLLGYDGSLFYCSHSRLIGNCLQESAFEIFYDPENIKYRKSELINRECHNCPQYTLTRLELQADIVRVTRELLSSRFKNLFKMSKQD